MPKESRFIIFKCRSGDPDKFLRHEGHAHLWTIDRGDAMEYTKFDVAEALANKNGGTVKAI
jgi:hypothetical protein